ncbi:molybdate ABC transporter substrate-binding protein [Proteiniborus sp. MB09-C3]|uniref:molybdate ABC transporter substrate-binding protein n=1 Tax=Proteiniborus sp. MB09-C3 TaxID=3050072 RepID=UPI002556E6BF|nr:molybdate ABC transporter substrate-binding protein [Proteiniborus sp. MB09-C3]WIV12793.1 molybdate ABC transporter substrate-binding protein [Proteiniborus sp. MB09-C3]
MKKVIALLLIFTLAFGLYGCSSDKPENNPDNSKPIENADQGQNDNQDENSNPVELTISAAASLTEAYGEIKEAYEAEKGVKLTLNFGASGTLQKQIEEGAEVDVFVSAGKKQMDALEEQDLIIKDTRENIYRNELALLVSEEYKDKIKSINDLVGTDLKLSIGVPETVPVGQYAKDALGYLKIWDGLEANIVYGKDVSQVLTYVEKGEVAAGIVFSSDSVRATQSYLAEIFPEETHTPIVYPAAVVASTKDKEASLEFLQYLRTDKAKEILEKYGFKIYTE